MAKYPGILLAFAVLIGVACVPRPSKSQAGWPAALPLVRAERQLAGCWRVVRGSSPASLFQLDPAVREVYWMGHYFNDHPLLPEPDGYDTGWHVESGDTARLEWRTPKRPKGAVGGHIYGGQYLLAVADGDTLRGRHGTSRTSTHPLRRRCWQYERPVQHHVDDA